MTLRLLGTAALALVLAACQPDAPPAPDASTDGATVVQTSTDATTTDGPLVTVYKSPTCGCCSLWTEYLEAEGFQVETHDVQNLTAVKDSLGVPPDLGSCHTATVEGYVIEGHVPAEPIRRLLAEKPEARGLAVPGMPVGSPGMEVGDRVDPYDVLILDETGEAAVYASIPGSTGGGNG